MLFRSDRIEFGRAEQSAAWRLIELALAEDLGFGLEDAAAGVHNSNSPKTPGSPTPCGSVDSQIRSNPPGHKGLGYRNSELL